MQKTKDLIDYSLLVVKKGKPCQGKVMTLLRWAEKVVLSSLLQGLLQDVLKVSGVPVSPGGSLKMLKVLTGKHDNGDR